MQLVDGNYPPNVAIMIGWRAFEWFLRETLRIHCFGDNGSPNDIHIVVLCVLGGTGVAKRYACNGFCATHARRENAKETFAPAHFTPHGPPNATHVMFCRLAGELPKPGPSLSCQAAAEPSSRRVAELPKLRDR